MASGYGLSGGPSRCFPFWQELLACYVVNTNTDDVKGAKVCLPALEDYYECLHHRKEKARVEELQRAYRRAEASHPRENAPKAGTIRSLGLLNKDEDTKAVIGVDRSRGDGKETSQGFMDDSFAVSSDYTKWERIWFKILWKQLRKPA
ncbi:MAG: hypothetical protein LQ345_005673 [Seirophora villosa]|nr:MAG: hypothetical protein LQ345_005673 [Seirophora villosa]